MGNREKTCEQRIDDHMEGRFAQFLPQADEMSEEQCKEWLESEGALLDEIDAETEEDWQYAVRDYAQERANEWILGVSKTITYRVELSTGGPADRFEFDFREGETECIEGRYIFQDWFDGARRKLTDEQADALVDIFAVGPMFE